MGTGILGTMKGEACLLENAVAKKMSRLLYGLFIKLNLKVFNINSYSDFISCVM